MTSRIYLSYLIFIVLSLSSCSTYKPVVSKSMPGMTAQEYIMAYKDLAIEEMKRTGIPASITLAQGMLESDFGRSRLAREANNHFGIKCHDNWTGPSVRHNDDKKNECFRKYSRVEQSYADHSNFIKTASRYKSLFYLKPTDYKGWARGLSKAGYATNPDYANLLIKSIEQNDLERFDTGAHLELLPPTTAKTEDLSQTTSDQFVKKEAVPVNVPEVISRAQRVMENNRIKYIIAREGDTKTRIEAEFKLLKWELQRYNELGPDFTITPGQILYLQPKREKAEPGKETYICTEGETMYSISQKFGIKLKSLYEMNRMKSGEEPSKGSKIFLRSVKPVM
jgi:LysM repeat protein